MAGGPDRAGALVQLLAIEAPQAQGLGQVVLEVTGTGEALVAHRQPRQLHQVLVHRLAHRQQAIDQVPVGGIEGMGLEDFGFGHHCASGAGSLGAPAWPRDP